MEGFVYLWENVKNGMYYIGSHKGDVNDGYIGSGKYFKPAYKKSPENFKRTIIYVGLDYVDREDELLKFVDAQNNPKFYNLSNSGYKGWYNCHTKEVREKARRSKLGKAPKCAFRDKKGVNNPMYGKKQNLSTKKLISESKIGRSVNNKKVIEVFSEKVFNSLTDCANYYGVSQPTISSHIKKGKIIKRGKLKNKKIKLC